MDGVVAKPIDLDELIAAIRKALRRHAAAGTA